MLSMLVGMKDSSVKLLINDLAACQDKKKQLDKIQMHVTTQVSKVEGVVDTTGAGKGLERLVAK